MGHQVIIKKYIFLFLKIDVVLANSTDLDEMPHHAAFHLDLHCLSKCPSLQRAKAHTLNRSYKRPLFNFIFLTKR